MAKAGAWRTLDGTAPSAFYLPYEDAIMVEHLRGVKGQAAAAALREVQFMHGLKAEFGARFLYDDAEHADLPEAAALAESLMAGAQSEAEREREMVEQARAEYDDAEPYAGLRLHDPDPSEGLSDPDKNTLGKFQGPEHGAPETQRLAAIAIYPKTGTQRRDVLERIIAAGERGMTDEELHLVTGLKENSIRPRRDELVEGGWVVDSGQRRATRAGMAATVWVRSAKSP